MKKITSIFILSLFAISILLAQSPEKMSFQAVVRDNANNLIINQSIGIQISILLNSENGTAVYIENHNVESNTNGLVSLEIGAGDIVSGSFLEIDWTEGDYFIKMEADPEGGTNYTITNTNQVLSVPYALYANEALEVSNEMDPYFEENFDFNGANNGDLLRFNGSKWEEFTPDYLNENDKSILLAETASDPVSIGTDWQSIMEITFTIEQDMNALTHAYFKQESETVWSAIQILLVDQNNNVIDYGTSSYRNPIAAIDYNASDIQHQLAPGTYTMQLAGITGEADMLSVVYLSVFLSPSNNSKISYRVNEGGEIISKTSNVLKPLSGK